jgi:hypothetical protein
MKQQMSQKEIELWDAIAAARVRLPPEEAYKYATKAIAARRAALIADAHVGEFRICGNPGDWFCRCIVDSGFNNHQMIANSVKASVPYCETCHTRRPDAVYKVTSDKQNCSTCKHEQSEWSEEPCNNCEFMSRWEMPDAVQGEVQEQKFENDAGKSCRNCKHKLKHWENEPCKSCDFSDKWEVHK